MDNSEKLLQQKVKCLEERMDLSDSKIEELAALAGQNAMILTQILSNSERILNHGRAFDKIFTQLNGIQEMFKEVCSLNSNLRLQTELSDKDNADSVVNESVQVANSEQSEEEESNFVFQIQALSDISSDNGRSDTQVKKDEGSSNDRKSSDSIDFPANEDFLRELEKAELDAQSFGDSSSTSSGELKGKPSDFLHELKKAHLDDARSFGDSSTKEVEISNDEVFEESLKQAELSNDGEEHQAPTSEFDQSSMQVEPSENGYNGETAQHPANLFDLDDDVPPSIASGPYKAYSGFGDSESERTPTVQFDVPFGWKNDTMIPFDASIQSINDKSVETIEPVFRKESAYEKSAAYEKTAVCEDPVVQAAKFAREPPKSITFKDVELLEWKEPKVSSIGKGDLQFQKVDQRISMKFTENNQTSDYWLTNLKYKPLQGRDDALVWQYSHGGLNSEASESKRPVKLLVSIFSDSSDVQALCGFFEAIGI